MFENILIATDGSDHSKKAQQVLQFSRDNKTDLIVLGSRGLSDVAGFFQGSVSTPGQSFKRM